MSWGYVAVAAATVIGGAMSSNAAKKASKAQQGSAQDQLDFQKWIYEQNRGNQQPFMDYGQGAGGLGGLSALMGGDYSGFMNSPDFKARVQLSNDQFNNGAAAKYRLFSGGAQNDRDTLNQQLAAQGLGDYRNALMWGANLGQSAASGQAQSGQAAANGMASAYANMGNAQANGAIGQGSAWASTLSGLGQAFSGYMGGQNAGTATSAYGGGANAPNYGLPATASTSTPWWANGRGLG